MMANTRLAMVVLPALGREHFLALFSVATNVSLGVSLVIWGLLIDACGILNVQLGAFELNRLSLFYLLVTAALAATYGLTRRLEEPQAARVEVLLREMLAQVPMPSWIRFWPRG
jgi:hypothetical protein